MNKKLSSKKNYFYGYANIDEVIIGHTVRDVIDKLFDSKENIMDWKITDLRIIDNEKRFDKILFLK